MIEEVMCATLHNHTMVKGGKLVGNSNHKVEKIK